MTNKKLCMAPWTHTYCSPQGERRLCCTSREPSQNFKQYIDSNDTIKNLSRDEAMEFLRNQQKFHIPTLDEHWNSEHMKSVRRRMMNNEELPECEVCNTKILNTSVYRDYFEKLFSHKRDEVLKKTDPDGYYHGYPVSFDYRFSNICNFKCRMCGPMLSSSWETENNVQGYPKESWMNYKKELKQNSENMYDEMIQQLDSLEEIYWVGGEPLMFREHWDIMSQIVKDHNPKDIYVRYNTNLSRTTDPYNITDKSLWELLQEFRDWQICASIDGTGPIGEYVRTGLNYKKFIQNFEEGLKYTTHSMQLRLDFTITTPGLFEIENMFELSKKYDVELLTKVCFEFDSSIAMCPLWLPKDVLHPIIQNLLDKLSPRADIKQKSLIEVLTNLLSRDTMEEKYPSNFKLGREKGKKQITKLEQIRNQKTTMRDIFANHDNKTLEFWNSIQ